MKHNNGLKLRITKTYLNEKTDECQEALKINFQHKLCVNDKVVEGTINLLYTSDTFESVKGYLYVDERNAMFKQVEDFMTAFLEALVVEKSNKIKTCKY